MGRIIKNYGYNPTVKDEVYMSANSVADINLMIFAPEYVVIQDDGTISEAFPERYHTACYAKEEEPGIHLHLLRYDRHNEIELSLPEIVTDEVEFSDQFYRCFLDRQRPDTKDYFKDLVLSAFKDYRYSKLKDKQIYLNLPYEGFGLIMADDLVVATFEGFSVENDKRFVVFNSVGIIPDSERLSAVFKGCGASFTVTLKSVLQTQITDMTYTRLFEIDRIVFNDVELLTPVIKLKDDPEDFIEERTKIINSYEKEETFEDLMTDLL